MDGQSRLADHFRYRTNDAYAWTAAANVNRGYSANNLNQYTGAGGVNFTYDANGNLTGDGTWAYGYNAINQLKTATSGSLGITANLVYDPVGRLYQIAGSGFGDMQFVYDGDQMATEYIRSTGALNYRYVFGPGTDEPIVRYDASGNRNWLHADERGSIVAITDSNGNPVSSTNSDGSASNGINTYDEYGIPGAANSTRERFGYTGQMYLHEIGLSYYKARLYSPTLGRFLQTDPIGYGDGMNWYNYVHADPVNGYDPTGLNDCPQPTDGSILVCGTRPGLGDGGGDDGGGAGSGYGGTGTYAAQMAALAAQAQNAKSTPQTCAASLTPRADKIAKYADLAAAGLGVGAAVSSETVVGGVSLGALALLAKGVSAAASAYSAYENYEGGNTRVAVAGVVSAGVGLVGGKPAEMLEHAAVNRGVKLAMSPRAVAAMAEASGYTAGKVSEMAICP